MRSYTALGLGYEKLGKFPEATRALETARSMDDSPVTLEMLGGLYATMGKTAEARAVLAELDKQAKFRYVCAYEVATIHAGLSDRHATLEWLEKGRRDRADCMPWMTADPKLQRLHADPEFQDMLHRTGLR
jgi:tetratricopeptide (TPR) repeat protein